MKKQTVMGIMSGTSLDGVDYVLCEISISNIKLKKLWGISYPRELRKNLFLAASGNLGSHALGQLNHDLGRFYAKHARAYSCDYVGLHGQTIFHNPAPNVGATFQLGEPAYLAAKLKVPVVNQFRTMDLALGGQGAPLATIFHRAVFSHPGKNIAVNNLGGISNVTFLPKSGRQYLSFDTGPANILIDLAAKKLSRGKLEFDKQGQWASQGIPNSYLVKKWIEQSRFFKTSPPKSTGREEFGEEFLNKALAACKKEDRFDFKMNNADIMATMTEFTAESIADSYEKFLPQWPDVVILCGGGAANPTLVKAIRRALRQRQWQGTEGKLDRPIDVTVSDALGWPTQSIEASAFAYLAYLTMNNIPGNIPETTGARRRAILGQIVPYAEL